MIPTVLPSESDVAPDALRLAGDQGYVPPSPGEVDAAGRVLLCAAACFAAIGLERAFGHDERREFESEVGLTRDKAVVYRAYERLGWQAASCRAKMEPNDSASIGERLRVMVRTAYSADRT